MSGKRIVAIIGLVFCGAGLVCFAAGIFQVGNRPLINLGLTCTVIGMALYGVLWWLGHRAEERKEP